MVKPLKQLDRHIESVLAALDVMDCFLENPKLSIKQIVEKTLMTRNRVTRILGTLVHRGYLIVRHCVLHDLWAFGTFLAERRYFFSQNRQSL